MMRRTLRVLHVEDSERDVALLTRHLTHASYELISERVETPAGMRAALESRPWDVILCDYSMPHFNALAALALLKETGLDIPFIIISGTIGEDVAVEAMRSGAHDYLMKDKLARLAPAIERELEEAKSRQARRQAEEELRESVTLNSAILNSLTAHIAVLDLEGRIIAVNKAWAQFAQDNSGGSGHTGVGANYLQVCQEATCAGEDTASEIGEGVRSLLEGRRDSFMVEYPCHSPEVERWFLLYATPFAGEHGGAVVSHLNITERKRVEAALKKTEEKYRSIFENAVEGIFQATLDGKFIAVNPAMARILGYGSPEELIAYRTDIGAQHYVDAGCHAELERMLAEQGVVAGYECEVYRKDRSKIWAVENVRAIRDAGGALLYYEGSIEDITERKTLEEQLRQSQRLEAVGLLAGGIAHDFNNMLTAITGYSELTLLKLRKEDPLHRKVHEIKKAAERAAGLTRQLLAFSRKQVLQPKVLDPNALVSELEKMLRRLIGEDVELRVMLARALGNVKADPGQLEQVIMNLAVNARDAMPRGGKLTIETQSVYLDESYARQHIAVRPGPYVMLAVSDTGTGMDAETQARIFEPFFTTKEVGKGTGLGLSTVYGIVKQSGGNIWVYSEAGRGTTFKIYLPLIGEGAQEYTRGSAVEEAARGTETILLAEDEEVVRTLAREVLESYGYRVLEAANGGAALLICERYDGPIHLLLTDVVMPEMSGRELSNRLAQLRPEMKVLYMSGYTDNAIVHQGVLDEGENFIQKPFAAAAMARKVREALAEEERRQ